MNVYIHLSPHFYNFLGENSIKMVTLYRNHHRKGKKQQTMLPFNINIFFKSNRGSKDMFNILNQGTIPVVIAAERKLNIILNKVVGKWKKYIMSLN